MLDQLSPPQRLLFFKQPRKRGKGGKKERRKKGKAEKRKGGKTGKAEKAREKGKSEESLCQISVEIWRPPGGVVVHCDACMLSCETKNVKNGVLKF